MTKKLVLTCILKNNNLECKTSDENKLIIEPYKIINNRVVFVYKDSDLFEYSIEIEASADIRIVCNAYLHGELTWGSTRYTRWETSRPVNTLYCISGRLNIIDNDSFLIIDKTLDENLTKMLIFLKSIKSVLKNILKWPTYSKYLVLPSTYANEPIAAVLRVDNTSKLPILDLVFSSLLLMEKTKQPYTKWFIEELTRALKGEQSILSLLTWQELRNPDIINTLLTNPRECILFSEHNKEINVKNICKERRLVLIASSKLLLKTALEGNEEFSLDKRVFGNIIDFISLKV